MFGIGFTELLLISIIAILFLGPDKLPSALVEMAKFIKSVKKTVGEAKSSLEEEMKISDLKEEALNYKKQLNNATDELKGFKNLALEDLDDFTYDETPSAEFPVSQSETKKETSTQKETQTPEIETKNETVTLKKKKKSEPKKKTESKKKVVKKDDNSNTKGDA